MLFLNSWYLDEMNHANGFLYIINMLYGSDELELLRAVQQRTPNFSNLQHFFQDEFKLSVLFAYDEYASTMTYKKDKFYKKFGLVEFEIWIKNLIGDEARHFNNIIKLIHYKHKNRVAETQSIIQEILNFENAHLKYEATFLFDHDTEHFLLDHEELNQGCANYVVKRILAG